ncbi:hypothetical protein [Streptomyces deccanensis]|uniref:hypothetical protein n=1 Tax=Streptomyces deccanensis TaxID=424188 RepID=UPI001EFAB794|nr:hypothetical protein [Streptomyces deccanensis]ULR51789.1 hypothetical protein L3078_22230 [Streptomyces deccanensis]
MEIPELDEKLLAHLVDELNDDGKRAVSFLRSAQALTALDDNSIPEHGSLIAYALREAMKAIPSSQSTASSGGEWKVLSREVVEAKQQLLAAAELTDEDREGAIQRLFNKVDALDTFHKQDAVHQRRLIAVIVNRTGTQPLTAGDVAPITSYQKILSRLDRGLHAGITINAARDLWRDCVSILRQLFTPPEIRIAELDELASLHSPTSQDVEKLKQLIVSPYHLRRFLGQLNHPAWLELLLNTKLLDPPSDGQGWPMFAAVDKLKDGHARQLAGILEKIARKFIRTETATWYPARAALDIAEHGHSILKICLQKHPRSPAISSFAVSSAEANPNAGAFVEFVASIVMNHSNWSHSQTYIQKFMDTYCSGLNQDNGLKRLKILAYRVSDVPEEELTHALFLMQNASLSEYSAQESDRGILPVLLKGLVSCLKQLVELFNSGDLFTSTSPLPAALKERARSWILANSRDVEIGSINDELVAAIATRDPLSDDELLIQRVVDECPEESYVSVWQNSLGTPPGLQELGTALAERNMNDEWLRAYRWSAFLPAEVSAPWATVVAVISGAYGPPVKHKDPIRATFGFGRSPITSEELGAMSPQDAAQWVASWSPSNAEWLVSARELGRALEAAVSSNAAEWARDPVVIASQLRHPTYIAHYLQGLANGVSAVQNESASKIVDLIELTRTHPWPVVALGNNDFDYDPTWRPTEHAGVSLIKALAQSNIGFGNRDDYVWSVLTSEVEDRSESSGIISDSVDYLETAINRPFTRALEAIFSVVSMERKAGLIRPDGLRIIDSQLTLTGRDGAEARAIIAPRVRFIAYVAPEWLNAIASKLFGDEAPSTLGQTAVDLALKWGQPYEWLLEHYRSSIRDAVRRGVQNALSHYMIAMLWRVQGYSPSETLGFLSGSEGEVSEAGKTLGLVLRGEDVSDDHAAAAIEFWELAVRDHSNELFGFGWMAEVKIITDSDWSRITQTMLTSTRGKIDLPQSVAERAAGQEQTTETLAILDSLVRGLEEEWDRREVATHARNALLSAGSLADTAEYRRLRNTLLERGLMD